MKTLTKERIYAGVLGLAIGDAVGVPFEFLSREAMDKYNLSVMHEYGTHRQPMGTFSDDTSMVLATLDAMSGNVGSYGNIMEAFKSWMQEGKYSCNGDVFDIGGTTHRAITNYITGERLENCGESDVFSNGNGSLMRMLPMVYDLWIHSGVKIDESTINKIYSLSGLTHAHPLSQVCCVYYTYVALYLIQDGAHVGLKTAIQRGIEAVERYYLLERKEIPYPLTILNVDTLMAILDYQYTDLRGSGYVLDSLVASLWALYNTNGYKGAVTYAVGLGEDTDTTGAITGSLAGLYYGEKRLPVDWLEKLRNKPLIYEVCNRFYDRYK